MTLRDEAKRARRKKRGTWARHNKKRRDTPRRRMTKGQKQKCRRSRTREKEDGSRLKRRLARRDDAEKDGTRKLIQARDCPKNPDKMHKLKGESAKTTCGIDNIRNICWKTCRGGKGRIAVSKCALLVQSSLKPICQMPGYWRHQEHERSARTGPPRLEKQNEA